MQGQELHFCSGYFNTAVSKIATGCMSMKLKEGIFCALWLVVVVTSLQAFSLQCSLPNPALVIVVIQVMGSPYG